ncbi:flagellar filament capping protein FliD [Nocardioides sp.]|uniref:flagellar filament capping protein FliD n=1 Tax=Nocardioides sp. TaxID=35761 RepID=UPI002626219F|nr:flagellar filament capping protein FliD [Nocardioides sp.]
MATIQFSGLASGLDTSSIITQLMAVETLPQDALKTRLSTEQTKLSTMQSINSAIQALGTAAASFSTGSTWKQLTATSTNSSIAVSAGTTATAANLSLTVNSTASAAKLSFADAHALTDVVADPSSSLTLTLADGTTRSVDTGDGTLKSVLANLNALKDDKGQSVISASSVSLGDGTYRVLLGATTTGAGSLDLSGANLNLGAANSVAGTNASIDIGAGVTVTSSTNTFTDVLPGVSITLAAGTAVGATSSVVISADAASRSTALKAMVQQINSVLSTISSATSYGSTPTTSGGDAATDSGALAGDSLVRGLGQQILGTVYTSTGGVLNSIGVSIDRYGQFQFDADKFAAAYAKDPSAVQDAIAGPDGFASRLVSVSKQISGTAGLQSDNTILKSDGQLTQMLKQQQATITRYNTQIADWDDRLAVKKASLQVLYTNLETTLSKLSAQQTWLTSALEGLSSSSSSSSS